MTPDNDYTKNHFLDTAILQGACMACCALLLEPKSSDNSPMYHKESCLTAIGLLLSSLNQTLLLILP